MQLRRSVFPVAIVTQVLIACGGEPPAHRLATVEEIRSIQHDPASNGAHGTTAMLESHMLMSPTRPVESGDSARATKLANEIRKSIAKYQDTAAAVKAGYEHFLQTDSITEVHFNNYSIPISGAFDPEKPTAILYLRTPDGLKLSGAMYNVIGPPKTLEAVGPLSIVRWHKHTNWCLPKLDAQQRWTEKADSLFVFGNFGTPSEKSCRRAGGVFFPDLQGWMVHANVESGANLQEIWGGTQMGSHMESHTH